MQTYVIRLVQTCDTALGQMVCDWVSSPPIFATVNRLRKVHYAWADGRGDISDKAMQRLRRMMPLTMYWQDTRCGRSRTLRPNTALTGRAPE